MSEPTRSQERESDSGPGARTMDPLVPETPQDQQDAEHRRSPAEAAEHPPAQPAESIGHRGPLKHSRSGAFPSWAPWAVFAAAAALAIILTLTTKLHVALLMVGAFVVAGAVVYTWSRLAENRRRAKDRLVTILVSGAFLLAMVPLVSLMITVLDRGLARFDATFFTHSMRNVVGEGGGIVHAILGTLIITGLATAISVPIGIMTAVFLQEYGRGLLSRAITFFVDVMTGIPSIVAGLFAFAVFALVFGPGVRLGIIGAVALSVLMIPIVVRSTEEMLKIVPNSLREASYALGVPKWRTITGVVLPTALGGIVTGVMIAVARVIGETAPLLVTTGVVTSTNLDPFHDRMANLPVFAFISYKSPGVPPEPYLERAWGAALALIIMVLILYVTARLMARRFGTEIQN
jgi:phosphate transport system permease protein